MSTDPKNGPEYEIHVIAPKTEWFDPIGVRFFYNASNQIIKIGFSHTVRAVEVIAFISPSEEDRKSDAIDALEGEIVEEEEYDV